MKYNKKDLLKLRNKKIIDLYSGGYTVTGIADEIKVPIETVKYVLKAEGVYKKKTPEYAEIDQQVIKLYNQGKRIEEIAFDLNSKASLVYGILRKYNLLKQYEYAGKVFRTIAELEIGRKKITKEIAKLHKEGHSKEYLQEKFKLSIQSINAIIRHHVKGEGGPSGFISGEL